LHQSTSPHAVELLADLERLDGLISKPPSPADIRNIGRSIWYRSNRDSAQTAVAKLYEAWGEYLSGINRFTWSKEAPIAILILDGDDYAISDHVIAHLEIVIAEFNRFMAV